MYCRKIPFVVVCFILVWGWDAYASEASGSEASGSEASGSEASTAVVEKQEANTVAAEEQKAVKDQSEKEASPIPPQTDIEPELQPPPKAKNIDLKEVVSEPLLEPEPAQEPESEPGSEPLEEQGSEPGSESAEEKALNSADSPGLDTTETTATTATVGKPVVAADPELQPALRLLGSEVLPGTSTRLAWEPPSVSFMGISAPTAVLVVNGARKGPTLCLTAAVHGDELNGIEIVRHILYNVEPEKLSGAIIGVPIVNLQGFRRSSRYLPDRRDLNRYFPGNPNGSAASRIAYSFFTEVVTHCDFLIDLHTASFKRTNLPQLRADLAYTEVADLTAKMGSILVVQSKGYSGSLRRAAVESGIPSVTLEAGEPHILKKSSVNQGVKSIQNLMHVLGMAKILSFWELRNGPVYYKSRWVRSVNGGILFSSATLGGQVNQGDVLGTVTDPITNLSSDIVSPYDGRIIGMALNQVLYPGYAAYHIGLRTPVAQAAEGENEEDDVERSDLQAEPDVGQGGESLNMDQENPEEKSEGALEMQILEDSE